MNENLKAFVEEIKALQDKYGVEMFPSIQVKDKAKEPKPEQAETKTQ